MQFHLCGQNEWVNEPRVYPDMTLSLQPWANIYISQNLPLLIWVSYVGPAGTLLPSGPLNWLGLTLPDKRERVDSVTSNHYLTFSGIQFQPSADGPLPPPSSHLFHRSTYPISIRASDTLDPFSFTNPNQFIAHLLSSDPILFPFSSAASF